MATNINDLAFAEGETINVEVILANGSPYTYECTSIDLDYNHAGVLVEYTNESAQTDFRVFLPYGRITQIWQDI